MGSADVVSMYRTMLTVRLAEQRFMRGLARGEFPGFYFPVQGMEAAAVGVIAALRPDDHYITTYRGIADVLAKGASLEAVFGELLGRVTGMSRGKGGTMHMADPERGTGAIEDLAWHALAGTDARDCVLAFEDCLAGRGVETREKDRGKARMRAFIAYRRTGLSVGTAASAGLFDFASPALAEVTELLRAW